MRYVVLLSLVLLLYFGYYEFFGNKTSPLAHGDLESMLKSGSPEAQELKASFQQILPKVENGSEEGQAAAPENDPHTVVIENNPDPALTPDEALNRFQSMLTGREEEALTFLRWCLFMSDFSAEGKEELFTGAITLLPKEQANMISRDLLSRKSEPNLFRRALGVYTQSMEQATEESFLQDLWGQTQDPALRDILSEHATGQGISLPQ